MSSVETLLEKHSVTNRDAGAAQVFQSCWNFQKIGPGERFPAHRSSKVPRTGCRNFHGVTHLLEGWRTISNDLSLT